jgi:hypothetical protein
MKIKIHKSNHLMLIASLHNTILTYLYNIVKKSLKFELPEEDVHHLDEYECKK